MNNMVNQVSSYVKTLEHREKREFMQELAVAIVREPQHRSPSQVAQRALEIYQEIEKRIKD